MILKKPPCILLNLVPSMVVFVYGCFINCAVENITKFLSSAQPISHYTNLHVHHISKNKGNNYRNRLQIAIESKETSQEYGKKVDIKDLQQTTK